MTGLKIMVALTPCGLMTVTNPSRFCLAVLAVAVFSLLAACASSTTASGPDEAYVKEAWAYFKKKCETEAGEKIYKTFSGVKSVLVVKPLPPATEKDLYDQFWMGDPYSNTTPWNQRDVSKADSLLRDITIFGVQSTGFNLVEILRKNNDAIVVEQITPDPIKTSGNRITKVSVPVSTFGVSWEDISSPEDRRYWVASSRLSITNLENNSVVAERIGFLIESGFGSTAGQRRPWLTARGIGANERSCPTTDTWSDRKFILRTLNPAEVK